MKNTLTICMVREILNPLGYNLVAKDGEFIVRRKGALRGEGYFTDDLKDALDTGKAMAARLEAQKPVTTIPSLPALGSVKEFKVVAVSDNHNSFGLSQIVMIAEDGEAYRACRCLFTPGNETRVGDMIGLRVVNPGASGSARFNWAVGGFELVNRMENAPAKLVKSLFQK